MGTTPHVTESDERVVLSFPPRPEHVRLARMLATAVARSSGLAPDALDDIRLLVSEACTNAVRAHLSHRVDAPITLACRVDGIFELEVRDAGGGFRVAAVPDFPDVEGGEGADGGFGIPLMQTLAVQSSFLPNEHGGTTVRLSVPSA